ncbi:HD-GYP domain-containing protein [Evansella sp. AB-rgal1]|uniref:HD-GYP domain-containing protein n=1 Tax=Evansella sp. AB-rgal1 TaxID=3242696 RepID=UPI00359E4205
MKVNVKYLMPGCILLDDVYIRTNSPLIKKKTVLTDLHISMLKIFLVSHVFVESNLVNGTSFKPEEVLNDEEERIDNNNDKTVEFIDLYLSAVQQYKRMFKNWQGGTKIEAYAIRKIFLPLYDFNPNREHLIQLHHYGTKNDYIYYHAVAVSILCSSMGRKLNLTNGEIIQLGLSGLLSDCGMSKITLSVFDKKSPLTVEEYNEVKDHTILGYKMLEEVPGFSKGTLMGVLQHHERVDGSGYPLKLESNKIHLFAKIIAVCDIYHAMTSERNYRTKQSPYKVLEALKKDVFVKIDHEIFDHFFHLISGLSIGRKVRLNSGETGEIVFIDNNNPTRPIIKSSDGSMLNTVNEPNIFIEEVVD